MEVAQPWAAAAAAARHLVLYDTAVEATPAVAALRALAEGLSDPSTHPDRLWELAQRLLGTLWATGVPGKEAGDSPAPASLGGPPWQAHVVEAILADDNPFTRTCSRSSSTGALPAGLRRAAAQDLRHLQRLAQLDPVELDRELQARRLPWPFGLFRELPALPAGTGATRPQPALVRRLHEAFSRAADWGSLVDEVAAYHAAAGAGIFASYVAFRWQGTYRGGDGRPQSPLVGIPHPDPTRLEQLVGYEAERERVVANTRRFVQGLPAHHLLLYGPRGTGKSVTVKALVHAFADQGLRLVELPRSRVSELPALAQRLASEPLRFVVLVDDLSFEEHDTSHRELKAALEGAVESWPSNVLVYATSNRRHLVREPLGSDGLARPQDEANERISLADRFAVTIVFPAADQELYLRIVEELVQQVGLVVDRARLRQQALQWALWHNERSPRTARQFVRELQATLAAGATGADPAEGPLLA